MSARWRPKEQKRRVLRFARPVENAGDFRRTDDHGSCFREARLAERALLFSDVASRGEAPLDTDALGGTPMDVSTLKRIQADPNYQKLVSERKTFGWTLAIITLILYYGYIAIVAFSPALIATKVAGDITIGVIMGVALILLSILLTGLYVLRANGEYDDLTNAIVGAVRFGGKK